MLFIQMFVDLSDLFMVFYVFFIYLQRDLCDLFDGYSSFTLFIHKRDSYDLLMVFYFYGDLYDLFGDI